ncbi:MAG: hypothetical protein ACOYEG_08345 [Petrimonas sp.]|jgi:hypothetical protein
MKLRQTYITLVLFVVAMLVATSNATAQYEFRDASGNQIGRVENDGTVRNNQGNRLGKATENNKQIIVASYFFFFFN